MKILNPQIHGLLDYTAATALIAIPFFLGLNGLSLWLSVGAGAGLILYSLLTDYGPSVARLIPFRVHLAFDSAAGIAFVAAPFVFGWTGAVMIYYVVMGAGVLAVVALSTTQQAVVPASLRNA